MKYDVKDLPGPPDVGCGAVYIDSRLGDGHERGDRVTIKCKRCGKVTEHEVLAPLRGLEDGDGDTGE